MFPAAGQSAELFKAVRVLARAAATLLAAVAVLEVACRVLTPVYIFNPDPDQSVVPGERYDRLRANHRIVSATAGREVDFVTNSDGYRDAEFPRDHPCLVLAFGNSFAISWGVHPDESWPREIERRLLPDADGDVCLVRTAALQGWSAQHLYEAAHDLLPELQPRVVVFLFSQQQMWTIKPPVERAFGAAPPPEAYAAGPSRRRRGGLAAFLPRIYNAVERHSALLGATKWHMQYLPTNFGLSQLQIRGAFFDHEFERRHEPTLAVLDAFARLVDESGARLLLAVGPTVYEVDDTYRYILLAALGGTARGLDFDRPRETLLAWADARGVSRLDLLPVLRPLRRQAPFYSPVDSHWNVAGHRVVGAALAPAVAELLAEGS